MRKNIKDSLKNKNKNIQAIKKIQNEYTLPKFCFWISYKNKKKLNKKGKYPIPCTVVGVNGGNQYNKTPY